MFGCVTGVLQGSDSILSITEFYEKPDALYAQQHLHVDGMEDEYFSEYHFLNTLYISLLFSVYLFSLLRSM